MSFLFYCNAFLKLDFFACFTAFVDSADDFEGFKRAVDINEHINTTFRMFNSPHEDVELICDNDVIDSIIDRFGEDVVTYTLDQKSFKAVVNIAVSNVFYSWIFGFGGKVKINSPDPVKEQYSKMLKSAVSSLD